MDALTVDSWQQLTAVPVAVLVSGVVVQFMKGALSLDLGGVWWRRISGLVAVAVVVGATAAGLPAGTPVGEIVLAVVVATVNGMIAGVAASKAYDLVRDARSDDRREGDWS